MSNDEIICPYCHYQYNWEDRASYISYWGEDGPQFARCVNCDKDITIEEIVIRTFEVRKNEEQEDCFEGEEDNDY